MGLIVQIGSDILTLVMVVIFFTQLSQITRSLREIERVLKKQAGESDGQHRYAAKVAEATKGTGRYGQLAAKH